MNNKINLRSQELSQNITNLINESNLPISNVYFIFKNIMKDLENIYFVTLNEESTEYEETEEQDIENLTDNQ